MQHIEADQTRAVERYLLDDMGAFEVDEFEEHFFLCSQCAGAVISTAKSVHIVRIGDLSTRLVFPPGARQARYPIRSRISVQRRMQHVDT